MHLKSILGALLSHTLNITTEHLIFGLKIFQAIYIGFWKERATISYYFDVFIKDFPNK